MKIDEDDLSFEETLSLYTIMLKIGEKHRIWPDAMHFDLEIFSKKSPSCFFNISLFLFAVI